MIGKMKYCFVNNCLSCARDKERTFFCFPRNNNLFEKWVEFCDVQPIDSSGKSFRSRHYVCDLHFEVTDFADPSRDKLCRGKVPHIKHFQAPVVPQPLSEVVPVNPSDPLPVSSSSLTPPVINFSCSTPNVTAETSSGTFPSHAASSSTSVLRPKCVMRLPFSESFVAEELVQPSTSFESSTSSSLPSTSSSLPSTSFENSEKESLTLSTLGMTRSSQLDTPRKHFMYKYAKTKERQLKYLQKKYKISRMKLRDLCDPKNPISVAIDSLHEKMSAASATVFASQLRCASKKPRGRRWTVNEKTLALSLYKRSPKSYALLSTIIALPSTKTLKMLLNRLPFSCGINDQVFKALAQSVQKMKSCDRVCSLMFDEISIRENLYYNSSSDRIDGFEDHGHKGRASSVANHALVFMVRGLFRQWKQPVAYYFSHSCTKSLVLVELIKKVIDACMEAGLHVVATICDMETANVKAIQMLGSTLVNPFFMHNSRRIYTLYDPPHLLKCTRNLFQKYNVKCHIDTPSVKFVGEAKWRHIEEVYNWDKENAQFRLLPQLTDDHLNPKGGQKMKVYLAAQMLSHRVSSTIYAAMRFGKLEPSAIATATFIKQCDDIFDSLNGGQGFREKRRKPLRNSVSSNSEHVEFWSDALRFVSSWHFLRKHSTTAPPSQNGWKVTLRAVKALWISIQQEFNDIKYLSMRNLNQDALENVFGSIRANCGSNNNPTVRQFVGALKTCIINGLAFRDMKSSNCKEDGADLLSNLQTFLGAESSSSTTTTIGNPAESLIHAMDQRQVASDVEHIPSDMSLMSTAYVTGFIARKLLVGNTCKNCRAGLCTDISDEYYHTGIEFREYVTEEQRLTYPTKDLISTVAQCANIVDSFLDNNAYQDNLKQLLISVLQQKVNFQWFDKCCTAHFDVIVNKMLDSIFKIGVLWWCKRYNRKLAVLATTRKQKRKITILRHQ